MKHDEHTIIYALIALLFVVTAGTQYRLYREEINMKHIISEGLMQIKEELRTTKASQNPNVMLSVTPVKKASPSMGK